MPPKISYQLNKVQLITVQKVTIWNIGKLTRGMKKTAEPKAHWISLPPELCPCEEAARRGRIVRRAEIGRGRWTARPRRETDLKYMFR